MLAFVALPVCLDPFIIVSNDVKQFPFVFGASYLFAGIYDQLHAHDRM
jgi:hypothetical protein